VKLSKEGFSCRKSQRMEETQSFIRG